MGEANLRSFTLTGLLNAVYAQGMPDYSIRLSAFGWMKKGVLEVDDLKKIDAAIKARDRQAEQAVSEGGGEDDG